jgi:hypothetical protein
MIFLYIYLLDPGNALYMQDLEREKILGKNGYTASVGLMDGS